MKLKGVIYRNKKAFLIVLTYLMVLIYFEFKTEAQDPFIFYNPSSSMPKGFYYLSNPVILNRGMSVLFPVPTKWHSLFYERGYLKENAPLLKYVGAVEGDEVCVINDELYINNQNKGPLFDVDLKGLSLPKMLSVGCTQVAQGYILPIGLSGEKSLDGRYIGFIKKEDILGEAIPLWTF